MRISLRWNESAERAGTFLPATMTIPLGWPRRQRSTQPRPVRADGTYNNNNAPALIIRRRGGFGVCALVRTEAGMKLVKGIGFDLPLVWFVWPIVLLPWQSMAKGTPG